MNKKALKFINHMAKLLPSQGYMAALERVKMSGEDLLLTGIKEVEGKPIVAEQDYFIRNNVIREIDHKMRMKSVYNKAGRAGLIAYLKPYIKKEKFGEVQVIIMRTLADR